MNINEGASSSKVVSTVIDAVEANEISEFMQGLQTAYAKLHQLLVTNSTPALDGFKSALVDVSLPTRGKQILQAAAWPIFDKPALPLALPNGKQEFLWLFALPLLVKVKDSQLSCPVRLEGVSAGEPYLEVLKSTGVLNARGVVSLLPSFFTRDDIQRLGPIALGRAAIASQFEMEGAEAKAGAVHFDDDIECARTVTLYLIGAARLPAGEKRVLQPGDWPADTFENLTADVLTQAGIGVEAVKSFPPCTMAETLFKCTKIGYLEIRESLADARQRYAVSSITLEFPAAGWAEVQGHSVERGDGPLMLIPPFPFIEPPPELEKCVRICCEELSVEFNGAYQVAGPTSPVLQ